METRRAGKENCQNAELFLAPSLATAAGYLRQFIHVIESCNTVAIDTQTK